MNRQQLENLLILLNYIASLDNDSEQSLIDIESNSVFAGITIQHQDCIVSIYNSFAGMDGIQQIAIDLNSNPIAQFDRELITE